MGFETVVRPVVFPNIRPQRARKIQPESDDPQKGMAVIRSQPARTFEMSYNYSFNASSSETNEIEREVDEVRIYQKDDDGTINRDNFVDVQIAKKIQVRGYNGDDWDGRTKEPGDFGADSRSTRDTEWKNKYKPVEEEDNIEIRERNKKLKNVDAGE